MGWFTFEVNAIKGPGYHGLFEADFVESVLEEFGGGP